MSRRRRLPPLRTTTPVSNLLWAMAPNPAGRSPLEEMLDLSRTAYEAFREDQREDQRADQRADQHEDQHEDRNLVRWVQSRLGEQTRTFVGEFRYYLWEFPTYTLWVANGKGFFVEVLPTLTPDEAMTAYREAMRRLAP